MRGDIEWLREKLLEIQLPTLVRRSKRTRGN